MRDNLEKLKTAVDEALSDLDKFETKGNKTALTRISKGMQTVKKTAQEIRQDAIAERKK